MSELVDIAGDLHTIFSGDTTFWDKVGALADLIIGTEFNNKGEKAGREFFNSIISKSDDWRMTFPFCSLYHIGEILPTFYCAPSSNFVPFIFY